MFPYAIFGVKMKKFELKYFSGLILTSVVLGACATTSNSVAQTAETTPPVAAQTTTPPAETAPAETNVTAPSLGGKINFNAGRVSTDTVLPPVDDPLLQTTTPTVPDAEPQAPPAPTRPLTPDEIAKEIAPNFDVAKDYNRLVQCYGTLDFTAAFMQVRASKPGAAPQLKALAAQLDGLKKGMQPFVLAASTVRSEAKFRADYSAVSTKAQNQFFAAPNPDAFMQSKLQMANACQNDARTWAGVK